MTDLQIKPIIFSPTITSKKASKKRQEIQNLQKDLSINIENRPWNKMKAIATIKYLALSVSYKRSGTIWKKNIQNISSRKPVTKTTSNLLNYK